MFRSALLILAVAAVCACQKPVEAPQPSPEFVVEPVAERVLDALPDGALHWRIETFPTLAAAQAAAGPTSLAAEISRRAWLFTLGPSGARTPGAQRVAEIGPTPRIAAARTLLRVNHAYGPPGAATAVHTHPGTEAFYVLAGELSQRTEHGVARVRAGETMNGHSPGMVMQLQSTGDVDLDQIVLFVVDADQPFSTPAEFRER